MDVPTEVTLPAHIPAGEVNAAIENAAITGWLLLDPLREAPRLRGVELLEKAMALVSDPLEYDWDLNHNHPTLKGPIPVCSEKVPPPAVEE